MKKLLSLIAVLIFVAWAGYKGAVWWFADQTMADIRRSVSDYGALERGQISSSVTGELTLTGTRFQPFRLTQPLLIERLQFHAPSPQALLAGLTGIRSLPTLWQLEVSGWTLALDAAMLRNWVTAANTPQGPLFAPVCGPDARQQLGSGDLIRMGIDRIAGDAWLRQSSEGVLLEIFTGDLGSVELFWEGARLRLTNGVPELNPPARKTHLTLRDAGTMRRITAYCARQTGVPASAWADLVMTSLSEALGVRGYRGSPQLLALYRQWLTEGGELELVFDPAAPLLGIPVRGAEAGDSDGDPAGAEPALPVTYNGARVPDVFLARTVPVTPDVPDQAMEPVVPGGVMPAMAGWRLAPVGEAGQWLGYTVRVTLGNGRVVEGRLTAADDTQVEVARPVGGGEVAYPMAARAIDRFEIWRRGTGQSSAGPG